MEYQSSSSSQSHSSSTMSSASTIPPTPTPTPSVDNTEMYVVKRNGNKEIVAFDKILKRIKNIGKDIKLNYTSLAMKVIDQLYDGISTTKIDELTAEQCDSMASIHPDYNVLAGRIVISNHHRNTSSSFSSVMNQLFDYKDKHNIHSPIVSPEFISVVNQYSEDWNALCDYQRDYLIDYFGFKTLERAYLMKINKKTIERPQHMWLRVSIGIHGANIEKVKETYELMSMKYFTHATPTLFNAGTNRPQCSSCFLLALENDSIDGIYNTLKDCALISKWAGGIGLHIHNVRALGSHIRGTNGTSNGIVPMLRVFNNTAKYVDQCVMPDTVIYTMQGPIQIQNCVAGETAIYGLQGNTEIIQNVLEHSYQGPLLEIYTQHKSNPLQITPEHPVFVLRENADMPEWVEAKHLDTTDRIVYVAPKHTKDCAEIDINDCIMYGIIVENGVFSNDKRESQITLLNSETKYQEYVKTYFEKKLVKYTVTSDSYFTTFKWEKNIHLPFRYTDFYDEVGEKRIHARWLQLPLEKSQFILLGMLNLNSDVFTINSSSYKYIESVRFLFFKMGIIPQEYNHGTVKTLFYKDVDVLEDVKHRNDLYHFMYSPIVKIEETVYSGILYDLQMEKEHNYMLEHGIVHNGGGKRNGSFAIYLEPWHADIELFLQMRKNHGEEELKARDLFYALWIPDLFMERVKTGGKWTLMCPDECPGLHNTVGEEFVKLYTEYEEAGRGRKTMNARDLWFQILDAQMETGNPYLVYKDTANNKSNQKNLGVIKSSNLCVAPETLVLTSLGEFPIKDICGLEVEVWNGSEWSKVEIMQTGKSQELLRVQFSNGKYIWCTRYHKFYKKMPNGNTQKVCAEDLKEGDEMIDLVMSSNSLYSVYSYTGVKVTHIDRNENRTDDTYCFHEPKRNMGVFNGILTGQCSEIIEYSDEHESAVCNLASIALPSFVDPIHKTFDYDKLHEVTKVVTNNLDRVIDINFYPTEKTKRSNLRHRPIGLGVQGLADAFMMMDIAFYSEEAKKINSLIFETIYHAALEKSNEIAIDRYNVLHDYFLVKKNKFSKSNISVHSWLEEENNKPTEQLEYNGLNYIQREIVMLDENTCGAYSSFKGSPASQGILQFDMWNVTPSNRYDWRELRNLIKIYGIRNSLLLAPMPTASTSQILGYNECIEPITSNIYSRRTLAGEFIIANKYLMNDLIKLDLWNEKIKNNIIANNGSIQQINIIPLEIRNKYKTVWELPMKHLIDMAADRGAYICQSQSLNLWLEDPNYNTLTSMHFYAWTKGLKTGIYYLRRRGRHQAQQFTIEPEKKANTNTQHVLDEEEGCLMCSA